MDDYTPIASDSPWSKILYPGSEHRFDPLIGQGMTAVEKMSAAVDMPYAGSPYAVEGSDMGDESNLTMQRALDVQGGGVSDDQYMQFVHDIDDANFDTSFTDVDALARNARYADQVGML